MIHSNDSIIKESSFDYLKMTCTIVMANSNTLKTINSKINKIDNRLRITLKHLNASNKYLVKSCQIDNQFDTQMLQYTVLESNDKKDYSVNESNYTF